MIIRPTRLADLDHIIGEPLPYRIQALTVLDGDRVMGIGGISYTPYGVIAFVQQTLEARNYPVTFHRAGLAAMRMIRESGAEEVLSTVDREDDRAVRWLERLGFTSAGVDLPNGRLLYVWKRPNEISDRDPVDGSPLHERER